MPKGVYPRRKQRAQRGAVESIAAEVAIQRRGGMKWSEIAKHHGVSEQTAHRALKFASGPIVPTTDRSTPQPEVRPTQDGDRSSVIVKFSAVDLSLEGATAITNEERDAIVKVARILRKHGVDARVLTEAE